MRVIDRGTLHLPKDIPLPVSFELTERVRADGMMELKVDGHGICWLRDVVLELASGDEITLKRVAASAVRLELQLYAELDEPSGEYRYWQYDKAPSSGGSKKTMGETMTEPPMDHEVTRRGRVDLTPHSHTDLVVRRRHLYTSGAVRPLCRYEVSVGGVVRGVFDRMDDAEAFADVLEGKR